MPPCFFIVIDYQELNLFYSLIVFNTTYKTISRRAITKPQIYRHNKHVIYFVCVKKAQYQSTIKCCFVKLKTFYNLFIIIEAGTMSSSIVVCVLAIHARYLYINFAPLLLFGVHSYLRQPDTICSLLCFIIKPLLILHFIYQLLYCSLVTLTYNSVWEKLSFT